MDSTDLTNLDAAITSAISAGTVTIAEVRDAMGNSTRYQSLMDVINARNALAQTSTKILRKSCFDKIEFQPKN
jgi:hypothetical protein